MINLPIYWVIFGLWTLGFCVGWITLATLLGAANAATKDKKNKEQNEE